MYLKVDCNEKIKELFGQWEETMLWSAFEGRMGSMYVDNPEYPSSAAAVIGDFIFLAGKPDVELMDFTLKLEGFPLDMCIIMPQHEGWQCLIETELGAKAEKVTRYATKKDEAAFSKDDLERIASSSMDGIHFQFFDETLYNQALSEAWSKSLVAQFDSYESYHKEGIGIAATYDGKLVGGASSYSRYEKGVEIEIDTKADWRNKGIGKTCAAKLILACLERNLYPSWDAQTPISLRLAKQLGYISAGTYVAYEVFF